MMSIKNNSRKKEAYEKLTAKEKNMVKEDRKRTWKKMVQAVKILPRELTQDPNFKNYHFNMAHIPLK